MKLKTLAATLALAVIGSGLVAAPAQAAGLRYDKRCSPASKSIVAVGRYNDTPYRTDRMLIQVQDEWKVQLISVRLNGKPAALTWVKGPTSQYPGHKPKGSTKTTYNKVTGNQNIVVAQFRDSRIGKSGTWTCVITDRSQPTTSKRK